MCGEKDSLQKEGLRWDEYVLMDEETEKTHANVLKPWTKASAHLWEMRVRIQMSTKWQESSQSREVDEVRTQGKHKEKDELLLKKMVVYKWTVSQFFW